MEKTSLDGLLRGQLTIVRHAPVQAGPGTGKIAADRAMHIATLNLMQDAVLARRSEERLAEERASANAALRESETRLQLALDMAAMGTFVWRIREDDFEPDARMRVLCNLRDPGVVGFQRAMSGALHPDDRERFAAALARSLTAECGGKLDADLRIVGADGPHCWIALSARARFAGDPPAPVHMAGAVIDITARKRDEAALRAALEEAQRARSDAEAAAKAKDNFLAVLSHELRTPLMPVMMATATLSRRADLTGPIADALAMIRRNIQLETRLVDDLLDVTRIERGKLQLERLPMDMHAAITQALEVSRPEIDARGQRLTVILGAQHSRLDGDMSRLQQAVWNLLKNASKFTAQGGEIQVRTFNEPYKLVVEVSDTGIGFDAEAHARIFDPFVQADPSITRAFGGLGLGLAIARASVLGHGGEILARSAGTGRGATFALHLPQAAG